MPRPLPVLTGLVASVVVAVSAAVVGLGPASSAAPASPAGRGVRPCAAVEVIAHRGLHDRRHTEDTVAAFAKAIDHGVAQIEGDLRLSGDGSWVFLHDRGLGRTTHGHGAVHTLPDAYLAGVRNNDKRVGLTFLPTALQLLSQRPGVRFEIEVKPPDAATDRLQVLLGLLDSYGVTSRVLLTSRSTTVIDRIRAISSGVQTALITRHAGITPEVAQTYGSTIVLGVHASRPALVAALRAAGLRVESWTVDSRAQFRRAVRSRSSAVITDHVAGVRAWCRRT